MILLSVLTALAGLTLLAVRVSGAELPLYLPAVSLALAAIVFLARRIPRFLRVIVGTLAATHILLLALLIANALGAVPEGYRDYVPPASMPVGAMAFSALIYAASFVPVIRTIMEIADRYFEAREPSEVHIPLLGRFRASEGAIGTAFLAFLVGVNLAQVALNVRLSFFSRDWFNALQAKDAAAFWYQLLWIFAPLAAVYVAVAIIEIWVQYVLRIRWRSFLNSMYVGEWLIDGVHYRMQLTGTEADNPDQRIAEDLRKYVDQTYTLSIGLLTQSATLVSFIAILWTLSRDLTLPGTDYPVPGLLVWFAILYAVIGTWLTHLIGKPLISLYFQQERYEADYRFALARLREYTEQVALLDGEKAEQQRLTGRFGGIVRNYMQIVSRQMKLTTFTASYFQANVVVPYVIAAPFYFAGKISLGQLQQTAGAFSRVEGALTFFISAYSTIADYKAVIDRLVTFEASIARAQKMTAAEPRVHLVPGTAERLDLGNAEVDLPDGRKLVRLNNLSLRPREATLLTGPSGSGKSTLFRAISGIWPFGNGEIRTPKDASMMLLPQRPYIPIGTLRDAVTYPGVEGRYSDEAIAEALRLARLPHLVGRLDEERFWPQTLSLGEQQRLAIARALLAQPDWLFLDEATAALDEPTEEAIYRMLREKLAGTTIVSIGHRSTLHAFHDRRIDMRPNDDGTFTADDARATAPAQ
ncbi:MAG TPA: ABC transporter ATP-binding protein/permease [Beijerinckiaceae bacterium]|nr:ABC transporter ATP-binding protein/permease [Beijerinckiaceae bacterium]